MRRCRRSSKNDVINILPVTAAREMYEPFHKLKYAFATPYHDPMCVFLPLRVKEKPPKKVCTLCQEDDFGLEVVRGAEAGLKTIGLELAEMASFKRGATDFSSHLSRMQGAGCDFIVLGTTIRETIGTIASACKLNSKPVFFYPCLDKASQPIRFWATKYKTKFNADPTVFTVYGDAIVDLFVKAAAKAGANLNTETFIKAMDTLTERPEMKRPPDSLRSFPPEGELSSFGTAGRN
jgi:branched-chain amino acid transport system substrate-binding protein